MSNIWEDKGIEVWANMMFHQCCLFLGSLSFLSKITKCYEVCIMLQARLQQYMNSELPVVQAGFRKGRGTRDEIATSVGSILFLSFIEPIFAWNVPLVDLIFLKRSLVFPILLFSSVPLHWSLRKAFLSLLAILWDSAFKWVYLSFSLCFSLHIFSQLFVRPPQTAILLFEFFFLLGDVLAPCLLYNITNLRP